MARVRLQGRAVLAHGLARRAPVEVTGELNDVDAGLPQALASPFVPLHARTVAGFAARSGVPAMTASRIRSASWK